MLAINTAIMSAAIAALTLGTATIKTDLTAAAIELAIGVILVLLYETLPPSVPPQA